MSRICYTLQQMKRHWRALKQFRRDKQWHAQCILDIHLITLKDRGIETLVLDFDGVLANHGAPQPLPEVVHWLDQATSIFQKQLYILSNKPNETRQQYFAAHYPDIRFIAGVRKKPYPDGLEKIIQQSGTAPEHIALIDDRLLTGVLATLITGCKAVWITKAYRRYSDRFWHEVFFNCLRLLEKWAV